MKSVWNDAVSSTGALPILSLPEGAIEEIAVEEEVSVSAWVMSCLSFASHARWRRAETDRAGVERLCGFEVLF